MYVTLAILATFVLVYSAVAGRLERTPFGGPLLYTAFGLAFGSLGLGWLGFEIEGEGVALLAELTLAMVLFAEAAKSNLRVLRQSSKIPGRLLLIGLPLTILLGFAAGSWLLGALTVFEIAILATMLAPTDAALGQPVVTNKAVPPEIRASLNVESGLNDGICVPILFLFLGLALGHVGEGGPLGLAVGLFAQQIGIGLAVGAGFAWLGRRLIKSCAERGWITEAWMGLPVAALALLCFATAQGLDGSGFIACFAGGLLFGGLVKKHKDELLHAAESTGSLLSLLTWTVFGAVVIPVTFGGLTWPIAIYAILSLTVIRMLPVFLSLIGLEIDAAGKLFIGWFGPRGLASIVFVVIVIGAKLPGGETLTTAVAFTVFLSVVLHGLTAVPFATAFGRRAQAGRSATH
jgi:NhaP-type Na+/H+ or K+/H+ antiporter